MDKHPHHPEDKCGPDCATMQVPRIWELTGSDLDWLAAVCERAKEQGQSVKVCIEGGLKVKRGESMWTAPLGKPLVR